MRHNANKRSKATQQRCKRHHDAKVGEETSFGTSQLVYVDRPPLQTSAADKMAVEAYFKLLSLAVGPYHVTYTTPQTVKIEQDGITNNISADRASLPPTHMQLQNDIVHDGYKQTLSDTSGRIPGSVMINQGKGKIMEFKRWTIPKSISSNMWVMAPKSNMWGDGLDTRHVTIH